MERDEIIGKIKNEYFARQEKILFSEFREWLPTVKFIQSDVNISYSFYESECKRFRLTAGHLNGKVYVDSVQDMTVKQNSYNHFVNAFAYWDLLTDDGKVFFIDLYKPQFDKLMEQEMNRYIGFLKQSNAAKANRDEIDSFFKSVLL